MISLFLTTPLPGLPHREVTFTNVPNHFPAQPDNQQTGPTHGGAAIDRAGNVYISTDTPRGILVFGPDGNLVKVLQRNLRMPATAYVAGDYVAIGELQGRVTILGKDNTIVAEVGDNPNVAQRANYGLEPAQWTDGICNSPHGVALDKAGNLIVSEWSRFGRLHLFAFKR